MVEGARIEADRGEEKLHFLDYWRVVKKRKEIIIAIFVIIVFATAVFSSIAKRTYSAYSQIKITQWQRPMDPFGREPARFLPFDQYEFETHRKLMESDPVLEKVVTGEIYGDRSFWQCRRHPQFHLDERQAESQRNACTVCGGPLEEVHERKYPRWEPLNIKWAKRSGNPAGQYTVQTAISMLKMNLRIRPEKGTRLITVRYDSHDNKEAQLIADMVAEAYIQLVEERRAESLRRAFEALERQIRIYQQGRPGQSRGLNEEHTEVLQMRSKIKLDALDQLIASQQLSQWTLRWDELRAQIAELRSEVEKLDGMTDEERVGAIQGNAAISSLLVELGLQQARLQETLAHYEEEHPKVIEVKGKIQSLREDLHKLASGVVTSKKADLEKLLANEKEVKEIITRLEQEVGGSQEPYFSYLIRRANVNMRQALLQQMETSQIQEKITNAIPTVDIQLVQNAKLPRSPVRPKPVFNVIISMFVGLTLGTGVAYFVEYLDTSMKTVDDVERYLNMSTLAVIPQQKEGLMIHENPKSHAAENYRMLWTNIQFARKEDGFKNIMITSGGAAEGKTTTVVNLGIAAAQMGAKALLVDSDLRRPKIHKLMRYSNRVGLSDVLLKEVDPRDVLISTEVPGLWAMPSGKLPSNVIGLLNSQKMRDVIATLSKDFDVLLYDSPPVMGVSDASVMASLVERVLLVIDYRKYPKRLAMRAKRNLENVGGKLLGAIINNLNVLKEDYYYYGYGYGKAYHYYYSRTEKEEEEPEEKELAGAAEGKETAQGSGSPQAEGGQQNA